MYLPNIKKEILSVANINLLLCKNRNWADEKSREILSTFENEFFCIEIISKYGEFNDIHCQTFDRVENLEIHKQISSIENMDNSKWLLDQYFSDGYYSCIIVDL